MPKAFPATAPEPATTSSKQHAKSGEDSINLPSNTTAVKEIMRLLLVKTTAFIIQY